MLPIQGQDVGKTDFERRLLCIEKEIIGTRNAKVAAGQLDKAHEPFSVRAKPFWDIVTSRKVQTLHPHSIFVSPAVSRVITSISSSLLFDHLVSCFFHPISIACNNSCSTDAFEIQFYLFKELDERPHVQSY